MFTRENVWMFLAMAVFLLTPISLSYMVDDKTNKCDQLGGVVVKSSAGWICIDSKELL